jgi:hypothetical protein
MNYDRALLNTLNKHHRSVVFAELGMPTRMTQARWAMQSADGAMIVSPLALLETVRRDVGETKLEKHRVQLTSVLRLHRNKPSVWPPRVVFEMATMGTMSKSVIEACVFTDVAISIRCLHQRQLELLRFLQPYDFRAFRYYLNDSIVPSVQPLS